MSQNRKAAALQDNFDCTHGGNLFTGNKAGTVIADIAVKGFLDALHISMFQKIFCVVRSCQYTVWKFCFQLLIGYGHAMFSQTSAHFDVADFTAVDKVHETSFKIITFIINIKTDDMDIAAFIFRGKFNSGNHFDVLVLCSSKRF